MAAPILCKRTDDTFGPYAGSCRGGFDFTLLFEETILSILPAVLICLIIPFRTWYLIPRETKVKRSLLLPCKLVLWAASGIVQIALVALWADSDAVSTRVSVANAAVRVVTSATLAIISYVEHQRTVRPSLLINGYLGLAVVFDITQIRTLWLQRYNGTVAAVSSVFLALECLLLLVESTRKENHLRMEWKGESPEATSGLFGKLFFGWLNRLFLLGFSRSLGPADMLALDKHLTSSYLYSKLSRAWRANTNSASRSLFLVYVGKLKWHLLSAFPPRLGLIAFTFCQPFLINRAIDLSVQPIDKASTQAGYGLIGAYIIVYVGIAVTTGQYQHLTYRGITMARGGLISMMFAKSSLLKSNSVDSSTALTLMSADIERITNGWQTMHEIWASVIEIALAIYLLERQLGAACAIPIAVAIVSLICSVFVMNLVAQRQALWLEAIERRISATTTMLGSMKRIKMCGITETLRENLHNLRKQELQISKGFRKLLIGSMFFAFATPVIAPVVTFTVFSVLALRTGGASTLSISKAYTSLSLFALLTDPLSALIMAMTAFAGSKGSFARIQAFLEKEDHKDSRVRPALEGSELSQSDKTDVSLSSSSLAWMEKAGGNSTPEKLSSLSAACNASAFQIENACFGWDANKDPLLNKIQMDIPRAKLTMIVGPVASGKTTLLKALLGEVPILSGTIKLHSGDISYCDQASFHMNGTVRDSVIAFQEFDERWYNTIVDACALNEDLRQLPAGDQTRIGSKGIALSGGQCQRLALARATYARNETCIFDDVLSGLDIDTENIVFNNLLGLDGILRRQSATVVLVSSSTKRLPFADHIVVLNESGEIAEQGSFKELTAAGGFVSSLDLDPAVWTVKAKETRIDELLMNAKKADHFEHLAKASEELAPNKISDESQLEANRRTGDISVYYYYIKTVGVFAVITFVVAICGYVFCISFPQIWLGWWADANAREPNANLGYWLGIYAVLGVMALVSLIVSCWQIIITMVPQSGASFHWTLLTTVLAAPLSFFSTTDTGITLNRFSQDLQLIDMDLPIAALNCFTAFVLCIAQIVLIGVSSIWAAVSFPIWFVVLYFVQKFYLRTSRQLRFLDLEAKSPLYSQFSETIAGLMTVRAFGWQRKLEQHNRELLDQSQKPFYLLYAVQRWLQLVLDLVVAGVAVLLMVLVVELRGVLSGADVGIALLNVILFSQHLKLVVQYWTMLETHIGAIARIKNFSSQTASEDPPIGGDVAPVELPLSWPKQGSIEFRSVSAGYDPSRLVLKDLTLSISAGEKIGICGRTGSGKSSLIMAIFGMIDIVGGSVTIDDMDLASVPRAEVRSRIIGLPQDVFLLTGSVRLNVDPYKKASDTDIISALEDVKLWAKIKECGGLDIDMGKVNLSHGQKQLLCLAQSLLRKSSILILDEATSSVDDATDKLIQRILRKRFAKHTIIAVAHKLETILDFDKVAVLDNGVLKEFDNPHTLLENAQSAFSQLANQ